MLSGGYYRQIRDSASRRQGVAHRIEAVAGCKCGDFVVFTAARAGAAASPAVDIVVVMVGTLPALLVVVLVMGESGRYGS